jgi:hypothetical protein
VRSGKKLKGEGPGGKKQWVIVMRSGEASERRNFLPSCVVLHAITSRCVSLSSPSGEHLVLVSDGVILPAS